MPRLLLMISVIQQLLHGSLLSPGSSGSCRIKALCLLKDLTGFGENRPKCLPAGTRVLQGRICSFCLWHLLIHSHLHSCVTFRLGVAGGVGKSPSCLDHHLRGEMDSAFLELGCSRMVWTKAGWTLRMNILSPLGCSQDSRERLPYYKESSPCTL